MQFTKHAEDHLILNLSFGNLIFSITGFDNRCCPTSQYFLIQKQNSRLIISGWNLPIIHPEQWSISTHSWWNFQIFTSPNYIFQTMDKHFRDNNEGNIFVFLYVLLNQVKCGVHRASNRRCLFRRTKLCDLSV